MGGAASVALSDSEPFALEGIAIVDNGDESLASDEFRSQEQAIVNGSTDFSGKEWMRDRTAVIGIARSDGNYGCSGTFLDPQTVMTARHCVTTNGKRNGTLIGASKVTVARWNDTARTVDKVKHVDDKHDVALLLLKYADRVVDSAGQPLVSTIEPKAPSGYKGDNIYISGWGDSKNNGKGTSALRWGRMTVQDDYVADFRGGSKHGIKLKQTSADQRGAPGDSGGPYWGDQTAPRGIIGVHAGDTYGLDPREVGTQAHDVRDWALGEIDAHHGLDSGTTHNMYFTDSAEVAKTTVVNLGSAASWHFGGGDLYQSANAERSLVIWRELVSRDFDIRAYFSSPDNDTAGVVFHYVDRNNFASCSVNDEENWIRLREVKDGSETTITQATWNGNLTYSKPMRVKGDSTSSTYSCEFDSLSISGKMYRSPVGASGVMQANNQGVRFHSFYYKGSRYEL